MSAKRRRKRVESALQDEEADNNALSSKRAYVTAVTERTTSTSTSSSRSSKMKIVIEDPETLTQWTSVGVSKGLTSDADIARFLLTLYWDVKENPTAAQKAKCAVCHTSLDLYCTLCRASSPHALSTTPPQSSQPPSPLIIGMNPQQSDPARLPVLQAGNDSSAPVHSGGTDTGTSDTSGMLKSVSHSEDVLTQLPDCSDIAGTGRLQECEHTVQPGNYVGNGVDGQPEEEPNAGNAGGVDTEVSDSSPHAGESSMQESYQSSGVDVSLTLSDKGREVDVSLTQSDKGREVDVSLRLSDKGREVDVSLTQSDKGREVDVSLTQSDKGREVDVSLTQSDKGREVDASSTLSDKGTGVDVSLTQSDKGTGIDISSTQNNKDTGIEISTQNNKDTGVDISSTQSDKSTGVDISSTQSDKAQRKSLRKLPAAEREIPQECSSQQADAELFVCLCCGVNLPSSQHRSHVRTHHQQEGGGFSCQGCSKTFPHFQALYNHSKLRARDRKCPQCQVTLLSGCQVTKHRRQHEREKARFCTHCRRSFPAMTKKDFDRHLTKHQTKGKKKPAEAVLCPQCGKVFKKKEDLNNHMTYHNKDSPFPCPLCPKAFKNRACLRQHRLFHGEKTQQCEVCGDKFYRKAGLRRHMQKHTGKRHACQECTHRFYSPTELQVHVDSVHKGIRHFSCPRCELRFYKAASLKIHMRTHTGEKPFGCDQCPARFTVGEALRKHMRRHTGEKPFVCEDCGQRYACQYSYTTHRTKHHTHRRYTCGHCPQAFVMRSSLRFHRKMCHEGNDHNCKN